MKKISLSLILVGILILGSILIGFSSIKEPVQNSRQGFVILELFTSQGCSSCPPADAILSKYALQKNAFIIPLAFHVDYWDRLGWKDPFSKPKFTARQNFYADIFNSTNIYTPQLVVNGKFELVGNRENEIRKLVDKELADQAALKIDITDVRIQNGILSTKYFCESPINGAVVNLALVKKTAQTNIKRGENKGLTQTSHNIVVDFTQENLKNYGVVNLPFEKNQSASEYIIVAYLQIASGKIIGAAKHDIQ